MVDKFNPAPTDKHAVDPKQAVRSNKNLYSELDKGLEDTFPARIRPVALSRQNRSPDAHG